MLYQPPVGGAADDPYVTGVPGVTPGSIPPGASIEHPQREIINVIEAADLTPDADNLFQLLEALNGGWNLPKLHAANGSQKLPGGLTLQWVSFTNPVANTYVTVTLPVALSTAIYALAGIASGLNQYITGALNGASLSTILATSNQAGGGGTIWILGK